jgi:hypothetical protein
VLARNLTAVDGFDIAETAVHCAQVNAPGSHVGFEVRDIGRSDFADRPATSRLDVGGWDQTHLVFLMLRSDEPSDALWRMSTSVVWVPSITTDFQFDD